MQESDRPRFRGLVEAMALNFRQALSPRTYELYWLALEDVPYDDVVRGVTRALREPDGSMPTTGRLRALAGHSPGQSYHQPWEDPAKSLLGADTRAPSPGEFRAYLRALAERKALR